MNQGTPSTLSESSLVMAQGFEHHQWSKDFEEQAAKRLRLDPQYHQSLAEGNVGFTALDSNDHFYDTVVNEGVRSLRSFDGSWTSLLEDPRTVTATLPGDFPWNFDPYSNTGDYAETLYNLPNEPTLEVIPPAATGNHGYGRFAPAPVDHRSEISQAGQSTGEETPQNQICFGMVSDVPITAFQSSLLSFGSSTIALTFSKPNQLFQNDRDQPFGETDDRTAKILTNLFKEDGIAFQIYCRTINRRAAPGKKGSRKIGRNELQYVMNTIVYGPEGLCDAVGTYLTKCGIYLQEPLNCDRDVQYLNPQVLSRVKEIVTTSSLMSLNETPEEEKVISSEDLFFELSSDAHLSLTEAPKSIGTPLYAHQKRALTFMVKREEESQHEGFVEDLWVKEADETGHMIYTNMITELSQKVPPADSKGGLLADQMGLGKSLTMISLIALNTCKTREPIIFTNHGALRRLKSTLVVVPYALLEVWNTQLKRHLLPNTLSWMRFHGANKRKTLTLGNYDLIITTFETLVRQQKKHLDPNDKEDTLFKFSWHRIVLDEAHTIRNRATAMARATCAIHATNRWAITGTPIQNRVTDFASLLEFLQIYPFSNPKIFDTEITKPWLKSGDRDVSRLKKLVNCISLCRTKAIIELPRRVDLIRNLDFSPEEQSFYDRAKEGTIRKFDDAMASNPVPTGQYLNALQWLNELRLVCNHGLLHSKRDGKKSLAITLQDTQIWNKSTANKAFQTIVCAGEAICSVCGNVLIDGSSSDSPKPFLSKCLTLSCGSCIKDTPSGQPNPTCLHTPLCKSVEVSWLSEHVTKTATEKSLPNIAPEQVSTKLKSLLESLKSSPENEKSVVFSYWTYTLDLIESLLKKASISYTRIDGQHSGEKREAAIQKFQIDESIQVILVSITCGGAGLDLTAASVAYLLEPQWNPMMEEQALCRIHRLGQRKEVKTIRYRIRGSFETQVVKTQELKRQIASEAFATDQRRSPLDNVKRLKQLREQLG